LPDEFDDCDDCDECGAEDEGGADGATFLGGGSEAFGRESLCCCGLSTGADGGGGVKWFGVCS
jgi:hypothetical protein